MYIYIYIYIYATLIDIYPTLDKFLSTLVKHEVNLANVNFYH